MPHNRSRSISTTRSMLWMPAPSICVSRSFLGRRFARPRPPSSCTRCWTARQDPFVPAHQRRQTARRQRFGSLAARARCFLHHGPRQHRLRPALPIARSKMLLCHSAKSNLKAPRTAILNNKARLHFQHSIDPRAYIQHRHQPEKAVAYDEAFLRKQYLEVGLQIKEPIHLGGWSGSRVSPAALHSQDIIVAFKS